MGNAKKGLGPVDTGLVNSHGKHMLLTPQAAEAFKRANVQYTAMYGHPIQLNDAGRSYAEQSQLYDQLHGKQAVARPGNSNHEQFNAIDVQDFARAMPILQQNGFNWANHQNDPWHFDYGNTGSTHAQSDSSAPQPGGDINQILKSIGSSSAPATLPNPYGVDYSSIQNPYGVDYGQGNIHQDQTAKQLNSIVSNMAPSGQGPTASPYSSLNTNTGDIAAQVNAIPTADQMRATRPTNTTGTNDFADLGTSTANALTGYNLDDAVRNNGNGWGNTVGNALGGFAYPLLGGAAASVIPGVGTAAGAAGGAAIGGAAQMAQMDRLQGQSPNAGHILFGAAAGAGLQSLPILGSGIKGALMTAGLHGAAGAGVATAGQLVQGTPINQLNPGEIAQGAAFGAGGGVAGSWLHAKMNPKAIELNGQPVGEASSPRVAKAINKITQNGGLNLDPSTVSGAQFGGIKPPAGETLNAPPPIAPQAPLTPLQILRNRQLANGVGLGESAPVPQASVEAPQAPNQSARALNRLRNNNGPLGYEAPNPPPVDQGATQSSFRRLGGVIPGDATPNSSPLILGPDGNKLPMPTPRIDAFSSTMDRVNARLATPEPAAPISPIISDNSYIPGRAEAPILPTEAPTIPKSAQHSAGPLEAQMQEQDLAQQIHADAVAELNAAKADVQGFAPKKPFDEAQRLLGRKINDLQSAGKDASAENAMLQRLLAASRDEKAAKEILGSAGKPMSRSEFSMSPEQSTMPHLPEQAAPEPDVTPVKKPQFGSAPSEPKSLFTPEVPKEPVMLDAHGNPINFKPEPQPIISTGFKPEPMSFTLEGAANRAKTMARQLMVQEGLHANEVSMVTEGRKTTVSITPDHYTPEVQAKVNEAKRQYKAAVAQPGSDQAALYKELGAQKRLAIQNGSHEPVEGGLTKLELKKFVKEQKAAEVPFIEPPANESGIPGVKLLPTEKTSLVEPHSKEDMYTLQGYGTTGSGVLNKFLRTGELNEKARGWDAFNDFGNAAKSSVEVVKRLTKMMTKHKLAEDTQVYRGLDLRGNKLKVGDSFSDKGFMSTTTSPEIALQHSYPATGETPTVLKFKLKKGDEHLPISELSSTAGEHELLLPTDKKFKVTGVEHRGDLGIDVVTLEPNLEAPKTVAGDIASTNGDQRVSEALISKGGRGFEHLGSLDNYANEFPDAHTLIGEPIEVNIGGKSEVADPAHYAHTLEQVATHNELNKNNPERLKSVTYNYEANTKGQTSASSLTNFNEKTMTPFGFAKNKDGNLAVVGRNQQGHIVTHIIDDHFNTEKPTGIYGEMKVNEEGTGRVIPAAKGEIRERGVTSKELRSAQKTVQALDELMPKSKSIKNLVKKFTKGSQKDFDGIMAEIGRMKVNGELDQFMNNPAVKEVTGGC